MSELTVAQALTLARTQGVDRLDAQMLLCALLNQPRSWLMGHDTDPLPSAIAPRFAELITRRAAGEPVAYLLGDKEFYGLNLRVAPGVLVPRPDTETLVDWALDVLPAEAPTRVLDLGTGSGAIALAIQSRRPDAQVHMVDLSAAALAIAQDNAQRLQLPVQAHQGSWFEALAGQPPFDLIVSNPPYIAGDDKHLTALRHEPRSALTPEGDGLADLRLLVAQAPAWLKPGAWLLLEHGWDQAPGLAELLAQAGYAPWEQRRDLGGQARASGGARPA